MIAASDDNGVVFEFGRFRLMPARQLLLDGDTRVRLGNRALVILTALVERPGELLTRQELLARGWPGTVVDESNIKVQIAALRKALGAAPARQAYLDTVVGRGYRFVAPVRTRALRASEAVPVERAAVAHNLPARLAPPIGRAGDIGSLLDKLPQTRLMTITGPGGIGKTRLALALAQSIADAACHDVWFVDLSTLGDAALVPHAVATALGLAVHSQDIATALENDLRMRVRPQLIVLDNCEHVVDAAAEMAERIVAVAPRMLVLATSREPLRAVGEHVYRLDPLGHPAQSAGLSARAALQWPAIALFAARAAEQRGDYVLSDADAPVVAEICRRLDGIALAIELAARRVDGFGARGLLRRLEDRFRVLDAGGAGGFGGPERHRTLLAMLDWSHQLLPEVERTVLRRLGVFAGAFALDAAVAVVTDEALGAAPVVDALASLVAKSIVTADLRGESMHYRLLDTTRAYARRKLAEAGELDALARRHAAYCLERFASDEAQWAEATDTHWFEARVRAIDDARAALDWAFSARGDAAMGVALTVSAIPALLHVSSLDECRGRVATALAQVARGAAVDDVRAMKLHGALAASTMYTRGMVPEVEAASATALAISERLGDETFQLRALFAACCALVYAGKHPAADALLDRYRTLAAATGNAAAISDGDRLTAFAWHRAGRQAAARRHLERVLAHRPAARHTRPLGRFHVEWRGAARTILSNVLWLQGFPEQALRTAQEATEQAQSLGNTLTLGYALVLAAVPLALYTGDLPRAESALATLQTHLAKHGLHVYDGMARCLHGALLVERRDARGLALLAEALAQLRRENVGMRYSMYLGMYARGLLSFGRADPARRVIDEALAWSAAHGERWIEPELLRIKAAILEAQGPRAVRGPAWRAYLDAIELARAQGALSLELRAATGLAGLARTLGLCRESRVQLRPVYARFTEGFDTADLRAARVLLDCLLDARA
ncbi:ATP-binding protein [Paraburkholderia acidisoli]|nr:winged helix-turn-helix domain-containing protein [Paraburkholderia acidisoli]